MNSYTTTEEVTKGYRKGLVTYAEAVSILADQAYSQYHADMTSEQRQVIDNLLKANIDNLNR